MANAPRVRQARLCAGFFACVFAVLPLAYLATAAAAQKQARSFALAVVRRDGVLIPFAQFDGRRWTSNWPLPSLDLQIPINVTSVPKAWWGPTPPLSDWQIWTSSGSRAIHVTEPGWVGAHCERQVALSTDYHSDEPVPPPTEQPYPKDGLAVSPPQPVEPIEIVAPADMAALSSGLKERFNTAELETARSYGHPIPRRAREAVAPDVEALYAFGETPRAYYVEASRVYRKGGDQGCRAIAFGTGWFLRNGDKTKWLDLAVDVLRCDRYGATYMLPLGALRIGDRTFWMAQYSGWDHERYVVVEVKRDRIDAVVSRRGGGC